MEELIEVSLSFQYQKEDVTRAYRFHYLKLLNIRKDIIIGLLIIFISGIVWKYIGFSAGLGIIGGLGVLFIIFPLVMLFIVPIITFKFVERFKHNHSYNFNKTNISIVISDKKTELSWSDYFDVLENESMFLLYCGTNDFLIIPKKYFNDFSKQAQFRKLLKAKISKRV